MPIQIDRMETSIDITPPASPGAGERRSLDTSASDPRGHEALREMVGQLMAEELDRFMRNRGM